MAAGFFLMGGCSNKEEPKKADTNAVQVSKEQSPDKKTTESAEASTSIIEKEITEAPQIPKNINDLINQYAGPFSGDGVYSNTLKADLEKKIQEFKPVPKDASEQDLDQLFNYMYSLVAEDYPDPETIIKKWQLYSFGNPNLPDDRYHFKENNHIEIILDASGSMAAKVNGKSKMELAKEAINHFLAAAPKDAKVSLRVYGHEGSNTDTDKKLSCSSTELIYGSKVYNQNEFGDALAKFQPTGWTPIADSLKKAKEDLAPFDSKTNTNLVFLVSDGIETCGGNPVSAAKQLAESKIAPIVNVIGFDVDEEGQKQMREVADAADGIYTTVNNQKELLQ